MKNQALTYTNTLVHSKGRKIIAMAALISASLGVMVLTSGSTALALPVGYAPNGCTWSPDSSWVPVYYNFKSQCNRHDYCYDEMWFGGGENGRKGCDDLFLREMQGWCNNYYGAWWASGNRVICRGVASTYYNTVRLVGSSYFNNPYKN
jgi:hypothetical protein